MRQGFFRNLNENMNLKSALTGFAVTSLVLALVADSASAETADWAPSLKKKIAQINASTPGELGVYIKRLSDKSELNYESNRNWYLASTTKVPVAIVLLQKVESGVLSLDQKLTLKESDYVDGSGELLSKKPGAQFSIRFLLDRMLTQSDSTAADLLIGLIGKKELNDQVQKMVPAGFNQITSILQVRYDAYGEVHPSAKKLTNLDFLALKRSRSLEKRYLALLEKLGISAGQAKTKSLNEAFERYYESGLNSATLESYGKLLERLANGELLSRENTQHILGLMKKMTTGERRIKAGLRKGIQFAQKTGTQVGRICNVGILQGAAKAADKVVVAACVEKFASQAKAEAMLKRLGSAISQSSLLTK